MGVSQLSKPNLKTLLDANQYIEKTKTKPDLKTHRISWVPKNGDIARMSNITTHKLKTLIPIESKIGSGVGFIMYTSKMVHWNDIKPLSF